LEPSSGFFISPLSPRTLNISGAFAEKLFEEICLKGSGMSKNQNSLRAKKTLLVFLSLLGVFAFAAAFVFFGRVESTTHQQVIEKNNIVTKANVEGTSASGALPQNSPSTDLGTHQVEENRAPYYRWGAKSAIQSQLSVEVTKILSELSASKAGNVDFGKDESGGKYFHFYTPKQNLKVIEEKLKALLGDSFYSELVTQNDPKSRPGVTRVVFVLFAAAADKTARTPAEEKSVTENTPNVATTSVNTPLVKNANGMPETNNKVTHDTPEFIKNSPNLPHVLTLSDPVQDTIEGMVTVEGQKEKLAAPIRKPSAEVETKLEPAAAVTSESTDYYRSWSEYEFSVKPYYSSIHSVDKTSKDSADFYSKQNFGGSAAWVQHWTARLSSKIGLNVCQESWDESLTKGKTLSNKSYTTTGFLLGGGFHPSDSLELSSFASLSQQSYRRSKNSGTEIAFETPQVAIVDVGAKKQFHLTDDYGLGLGIDLFSTLPKSLPNYSIEFSPGLKIGASLRQSYNASFLEAQLFWDYQKLNSSILEETRSSLGLSITFGFGANPNKKSIKNADKQERAP